MTRIAVDARLIGAGGIGTYLREVVGPWLRDPEVGELILLGDPRALGPWIESNAPEVPFRVVRWQDRPYRPATHLRWPIALAREVAEADVLFFPHYDVPLTLSRRDGSPTAVTIHDLTHFLLPKHFPAWKRRAGIFLLRSAIRHADLVFTVSERTRADLESMGLVEGKSVRVVPNGTSRVFTPAPADAPVPRPGTRPFLLLVGWDRPHKNSELAVAVLARLARRGIDLDLALVGEGGRMRPPVLARAAALGVEDRLLLPGTVGPEALRDLYRSATAVLVPSLYEGFGLPAIEAMACGAPVLLSDRGALPEIAGPAPVLDPEAPEAWTDAVERIVREGWPPDLRLHGIAHARGFDWAETSRKILGALRELREGTFHNVAGSHNMRA